MSAIKITLSVIFLGYCYWHMHTHTRASLVELLWHFNALAIQFNGTANVRMRKFVANSQHEYGLFGSLICPFSCPRPSTLFGRLSSSQLTFQGKTSPPKWLKPILLPGLATDLNVLHYTRPFRMALSRTIPKWPSLRDARAQNPFIPI